MKEINDIMETCTEENSDLRALLESWQQEYFYNRLIAENVTTDILKITKPHHIRHLLVDNKIGEQILFEHNLSQWRNSIGIGFDEEVRKIEGESQPSFGTILSTLENLPNMILEQNENESVTLSDVLNNHRRNLLIEKYENQNSFQDDERLMLTKLVAKYFEDNNIHLSLATSYRIEEEIVARFPTEKVEFYRAGKLDKI